MIAWTLQATRTGPHILTRVGISTGPNARGQVGELMLTPEAYADLARRLDVAHCRTCGKQMPAAEVHAGYTKCETCDPLQMPTTTGQSDCDRAMRVSGFLGRLKAAVNERLSDKTHPDHPTREDGDR